MFILRKNSFIHQRIPSRMNEVVRRNESELVVKVLKLVRSEQLLISGQINTLKD